jgi:hypothetical protein
MSNFFLTVSYTQVSIFDRSLQSPFNDWTDAHVRQGFAWRPGSVSFGTLRSQGPLAVRIGQTPFDEPNSRALRVIAVPFSVSDGQDLEVATMESGAAFVLPPGAYELTFEHGLDESNSMWANFYFLRAPSLVEPRILRADTELTATTFLMSAEPA